MLTTSSTALLATVIAGAGALLLAPAAGAATKTLPLDSANGIKAHHATVEVVTYKGRRAIKVVSDQPLTPRKPGGGPGAPGARERGEQNRPLVEIEGVEFGNGTIEVELASLPRKGAFRGARGFAGVAFRVQPDRMTYDCFYLRPTNGRADDQLRRNHSVQYISHPGYPWFKLRKEAPGKYESYADLAPGEWTKVKITVDGEKARLYLHGNAQPTLVINDVKSGPHAKGAVMLWLERSTVAYYSNLRITTP